MRSSPCVTKRSEACSAMAERRRSSGKDESDNSACAGGERPRRSSGSNGDGGVPRAWSEGERGWAGGCKWQRGRRRTRPCAPGGRLGRVRVVACAPRGGRALPARHGGTARPSTRGRDAGASAGKGVDAARGGWAGFAGWAGWLAPARQ